MQDKAKNKSPEILMIDFDSDISDVLIKKGFSVEKASFGKRFRLPNREESMCCDIGGFIDNLIEKDVVIINMKQQQSNFYMNTKEIYNLADGSYIVSKSHQEVFDQISINSFMHKDLFFKMCDKETIFVVFADEKLEEEYEILEIKNGRTHSSSNVISNFDFFPRCISVSEKIKSEKYEIINNDISNKVLKNYNGRMNSNCTFGITENTSTFPLIKNIYGNVIGYAKFFDLNKMPTFTSDKKDNRKITFIVLPQVEDFNLILDNILTDFLPSQYPDMFADLVKDSWVEKDCYMLPEIKNSFEQRRILESEYKKRLEEIDKKIKEEKEKNQFLYNIISSSGTGDKLVKNIIKCLEYLDYPKVVDWDEENDLEENEEDLHIYKNDKEYFIGEVKGVNGPPIEDDCNEIVKYKSRNCDKLDIPRIHGVNFFNFRKNVEPNLREEPGFTIRQIKDAERDKYTLVGTYELFKAIRLCQENILSKENVRKNLETPGLFKSIPNSFVKIGKINNLLKKAKVICIVLECDEIKAGDELLLVEGNDYYKSKIISMQVNDKDVTIAKKGDGVGIKIEGKFPNLNSTNIYLIK